jgi:hypothetical protein
MRPEEALEGGEAARRRKEALAAIEAAFANAPRPDDGLKVFARSKYATLNDAQREAIVGFFDAVKATGNERDGAEADRALAYWRP